MSNRKRKGIAGLLLALLLSLAAAAGYGAPAASAAAGAVGKAQIAFSGGELKLVSVPVFDFGRRAKPTADTYYAAVYIGSSPLTIQNTENAGWKLMATLSAFSDGRGATLAGAKLYFNTRSAHIKPKAGQSLAIAPPTASPAEVVSGGAAVQVAAAPVGAATGVWSIDWQGDGSASQQAGASTGKDVELKVVASTVRHGSPQAKLDWNLVMGP